MILLVLIRLLPNLLKLIWGIGWVYTREFQFQQVSTKIQPSDTNWNSRPNHRFFSKPPKKWLPTSEQSVCLFSWASVGKGKLLQSITNLKNDFTYIGSDGAAAHSSCSWLTLFILTIVKHIVFHGWPRHLFKVNCHSKPGASGSVLHRPRQHQTR